MREFEFLLTCVLSTTADKREFLRISQAVGMGFLIMGVIGYIVKLSKFVFVISRPSLFQQKTSRAGGGRASETLRRGKGGQARHGVVASFWYSELTYPLPLAVHIPVNNILVGGA